MAPPILYPGYYPGTRPLKGKRGRPRKIFPDPFLTDLTSAINVQGSVLGLPNQIGELFEKDFTNGLKIRYGISEVESGVAAEELQAIEEEYQELPGAMGIGISFDPEVWKKKGFEQNLRETGEEWINAVLGFKDLSVRTELAGVWDPLLNPTREATEAQKKMSLHAISYAQKYVNEPGGPQAKEFSSVNDLSNSIRNFVVFGNTASERGRKFDTVQLNFAFALSQVVNKDTKVANFGANILAKETALSSIGSNIASLERRLAATTDPDTQRALQDQLDLLHADESRINAEVSELREKDSTIKTLNARLDKALTTPRKERALKLTQKARARLEAQLKTESDPATRASIEARITDLKKDENDLKGFLDSLTDKDRAEQRKELKGLWGDAVNSKDGELKDALNEVDDKKLAGWAKLVDFRNNVFTYNEYIDSAAEGRLFQTFVWNRIRRALPFLGQAYSAKMIIDNPLRFAISVFAKATSAKGYDLPVVGKFRIPFVNRLMTSIGKFLDGTLGKIAKLIARSPILRGIVTTLTGGLVRSIVNKAVMSIIAGAGVTGVGTIPAAAAAALTYVGEKGWSIFVSFIKLDISGAIDKIAKEFSNLLKLGMLAIGVPIFLIGAIFYMVINIMTAPMSGTSTVGRGGATGITSGGGTGTVGGGGSSCSVVPKGFDNDLFSKMEPFGSPKLIDVPDSIFFGQGSCYGECRTSVNYLHGGLDLNTNHDYSEPALTSPYQGDAVVFFANSSCTGGGKGCGNGFGNHVILKVSWEEDCTDYGECGTNMYIYFAHLSSLSVSVGDTVSYGEGVGKLGNTGNSTGPHLHFEIRSGSTNSAYTVNPCFVFSCDPISDFSSAARSSCRPTELHAPLFNDYDASYH